MPFGLCNAPATFQRLMDLLLAGLQWSACLIYLDDISVGMIAGLKLKPGKCAFLQKKVLYLLIRHIVSEQGITPAKTAKVTSWPTPK